MGYRYFLYPDSAGVSIQLTSILCPNTRIWHYAIHVKTRKSLRQCFSWKFLLHAENKMYLKTENPYFWASPTIHWWLHPFLQFWTVAIKIPSESIRKTESDGIILRYSKIRFSFFCLFSLQHFTKTKELFGYCSAGPKNSLAKEARLRRSSCWQNCWCPGCGIFFLRRLRYIRRRTQNRLPYTPTGCVCCWKRSRRRTGENVCGSYWKKAAAGAGKAYCLIGILQAITANTSLGCGLCSSGQTWTHRP